MQGSVLFSGNLMQVSLRDSSASFGLCHMDIEACTSNSSMVSLNAVDIQRSMN